MTFPPLQWLLVIIMVICQVSGFFGFQIPVTLNRLLFYLLLVNYI